MKQGGLFDGPDFKPDEPAVHPDPVPERTATPRAAALPARPRTPKERGPIEFIDVYEPDGLTKVMRVQCRIEDWPFKPGRAGFGFSPKESR